MLLNLSGMGLRVVHSSMYCASVVQNAAVCFFVRDSCLGYSV